MKTVKFQCFLPMAVFTLFELLFTLLIIGISLIAMFINSLSGNPHPYKGEYPELYTTAVYSIPQAVGYIPHGEGTFDSEITVLEQDDYGRTLFQYDEDFESSACYLVICQFYDENDVFFYPEVNYLTTTHDELISLSDREYRKLLSDFKNANDWNRQIDLHKCVTYEISDHKKFPSEVTHLKSKQYRAIFDRHVDTLGLENVDRSPRLSNTLLQADAEGRALHQINGYLRDYDGKGNSYYITLWIITAPDGSYDVEKSVLTVLSSPEYETVYPTPDRIRTFKESNGWVYPHGVR